MKKSRKSKSSSAVSKALIWSNEEWAAMVAWLDLCLTEESGYGKFVDTIEEHLTSKWPDRHFDISKIERKLHSIWNSMGHLKYVKRGDIIRLGSQCIDPGTLNDDERSALTQARLALGLPALWEIHDSNSELYDRDKAQDVKVVVERNKRKFESDTPDSYSDEEESIRCKRPQLSTSKDQTAPGTHSASDNRTIAGLEAHLLHLNPNEHQISNLLLQFQLQELRINSFMKELEQLSRRISDCSNKINRHITSHNSAKTWDTSDSISIQSTFAKYEEQLDTLRKRLQTCSRLTSSRIPTSITVDELVERLTNIQDKIKRLFQQKLSWGNLSEIFQPSEKLESLLWRVFIPKRERKTSIRQELEAIAPARPNNLLSALVGTAACQWIFESDFPNSDYAKSSLLQLYRWKLADQQDGLLFLRNLDYDAYEDIVKEPFTQHFRIRLRAEELTVELFALLAPLINACQPAVDELAAILDNERDACIDVFSDCLQLKADSILMPDVVYELRMSPAEDLKFGSSIECEDRTGAPLTATMSGMSRDVLLCMFPGLWVHRRARKSSEATIWEKSPIGQVLVDLMNFRKLDDQENKSATMIKKPLVVCRG